MPLTLNGKNYEFTEKDVYDPDGFPPYSSLAKGKLVLCKYERTHYSKGTEEVCTLVDSADEMEKLFNSSEEGALSNMSWHLVKEISPANEINPQLNAAQNKGDSKKGSQPFPPPLQTPFSSSL